MSSWFMNNVLFSIRYRFMSFIHIRILRNEKDNEIRIVDMPGDFNYSKSYLKLLLSSKQKFDFR